MEMRKVIPEQHRPKYKQLHSFSSAPSIAQIASYVIFISQALLFYVFLFNQLQKNVDKIIMVCLFTVSLFILMLFTIVTGQLDLTDSLLIASMQGEMDKQALYQMKKIARFKDTNQERTINCSYCKSDVKMRSRHCKACDKFLFTIIIQMY